MLGLLSYRTAGLVAVVALALGLGLLVAAVVAAPSAFGDATTTGATACPTAPVAYTGTDPEVQALVAIQEDGDQSCTAETTASHDAALAAAGQVLTGPLTVTDPSVETVQQTGTEATGTVAVSNFPDDQQVSADNQTLSAVDADSQGIHEDLWAICGTVVGCFAFWLVTTRVWPS